jgi:hypothetical protein
MVLYFDQLLSFFWFSFIVLMTSCICNLHESAGLIFLLVTEACGFAGREDERSCKTKSKRGEKETRIGGEHWLYMPHKCVL